MSKIGGAMIPVASDPKWAQILRSNSDVSAATLATKLLVTLLRREVAADPSYMPAAIEELRLYFERNTFAQKDIPLL